MQSCWVSNLVWKKSRKYFILSHQHHIPSSPCLFRLLAASGHQKLLRTAKRSAFQPASMKFVGTKTIKNQHKHIIGWVVVIVGIRHFLDPEPYEQLYLPPHVIVMILRFSSQPNSPHSQIFKKAGQKKAEPNRPSVVSSHHICCEKLSLQRGSYLPTKGVDLILPLRRQH
jgi:hypothetical protein